MHGDQSVLNEYEDGWSRFVRHSHHYLLLLLGIDAKGLLLCGRTMVSLMMNSSTCSGYLLMIVHTFLRFRLSIALSTTVHFRSFQEYSKVRSGHRKGKQRSVRFPRSLTKRGTPDLKAGICAKIIATISVPPVEAPTLKYHSSSHCWENNCKTQLRNTSCVSGELRG